VFQADAAGEGVAAGNLYHALGGGRSSLKEMIAELEYNILQGAIEAHGSISEVARTLKVDRSTLFRKLRRGRNGR